MNRRHSLIAIAALLLFNPCRAAEEFQIPKTQPKDLVGAWKVIKMGQADPLQAPPEGRSMGMVFKADGTGVQQKGDREIPINWGADDKGVFAAQWKQEGGNGDGIMGTWKMTDKGLRLAVQEFEDGKGPGEDRMVLLLDRVEPEGE
jgi:hypothetical protein